MYIDFKHTTFDDINQSIQELYASLENAATGAQKLDLMKRIVELRKQKIPESVISSPDGNDSFGEINQEIAHAIGRQAGKIILQYGKETENEKFGLVHIKAGHSEEIEQTGLSIEEFVFQITKSPDVIRKAGGGALLLEKKIEGKKKITNVAIVKLTPNETGDFYRVETALVSRTKKLDEKHPPLWVKSETTPSGIGDQIPLAALSSENTDEDRPNGTPGQSDLGIIIEQTQEPSTQDLGDLDPNSPNYRYRDTGYIAGSRKEEAAAMIRNAAKLGETVKVGSIDFEEIEKNPREAKTLITKSNLFGAVDWEAAKANGMTPAAGFLIDRVYASIAKEPEDNPQFRRDYALGIESIRERMEKCKTPEEVTAVLVEIKDEWQGVMMNATQSQEYQDAVSIARELMEKSKAAKEANDEVYQKWNRAQNQLNSAKYEQRKRSDRKWKPDPELDAKVAELSKIEAAANKEYIAYRDAHPELQSKKRILGNGYEAYDDDLQYEYRLASNKASEIKARVQAKNLLENESTRAWITFGEKFHAVLNYRGYKGSDAFSRHVATAKQGNITDWSWAEKDPRTVTVKGATKEQTKFQLKVADNIERVGGKPVSAESTQKLKEMLGLRDVQSGNWVLQDPASAAFHVQRCAEAFSDLGDIIGVDMGNMALGGRLAMAFGARGRGAAGGGAASAHYEPVHRVINLTKMSGGGSLGHEWLHSLDNMIAEIETGKPTGTGDFVSENPTLLPAGAIQQAFVKLRQEMLSGDVPQTQNIDYTDKDLANGKHNFDRRCYGFALNIKNAGNLEAAIDVINDYFKNDRPTPKNIKNKANWTRITAAYYDAKPEGGSVKVKTGETSSSFYTGARTLDGGKDGKYWSKTLEMFARAFQSYCEDKLAEQGRKNDYLSSMADNKYYKDPLFGDTFPYPEGEERKRINAAFDQLFASLKEAGTLQKALDSILRNYQYAPVKPVFDKVEPSDISDIASLRAALMAAPTGREKLEFMKKIVALRKQAQSEKTPPETTQATQNADESALAQNPDLETFTDSDLKPEGDDNIVKTAKGLKVTTGFAVIEAAKLIVSHDNQGNINPEYPYELQPRDRKRAESVAWVLKTARDLDVDSLGKTRRADSGAPIVGKDRVVESGNGRTMAIIEAYRIGTAEEYREWLIDEAESFGISQGKVKSMKKPVLVRVRKSKLDRVAFATDANTDDKLAMTATEKARSDANFLDDALISKLIDGDLSSTQNRPFVLGFLQSLGDAQAAQYSTTSGEPTKQLFDRLQAAIFARAYNDDRLLEMMADDSKPEIKNIITALNSAAPDFVKAKGLNEKETGKVSAKLTDSIELSLDQEAIDTIIKATNAIMAAKDKGLTIEEYLAQTDLFGNGIDATTGAMALFIKENNRSSGRLSVAFKEMAAFVNHELENSKTQNLFGDSEPISLNDVLKAANDALKRQYGDTQQAMKGAKGDGFIDLFTVTRGKKERDDNWKKEQQQQTQESENAPDSSDNLESNSQTPRTENEINGGTILNDGGANGNAAQLTGEETSSAGDTQQGDTGISDVRTPADGEQGNPSVDEGHGQFGLDTRHSNGEGSDDDSGQGILDDRERNSELDAVTQRVETLTREQKKQLQADAENIPYEATEENIRATLPFLLPEQQDDIIKIEKRFDNDFGMMITNGTGTGKTYTALGAIKRFDKKGKKSILIVVPGDKIASDFIESAENLHLKIKALEGITDNGGEGISITSYANFYQNESLRNRHWDMVVFDEAHKINSNAAGEPTAAQQMMRDITLHPSKIDGLAGAKAKEEPYKSRLDEIRKERDDLIQGNLRSVNGHLLKAENIDPKSTERIEELNKQIKEILAEIHAEITAKRSKVLMLSATPFAYEKSIDYAEGYLFDYPKTEGGGYNSGSGQDQFMMQQFGYSMRYNKLTRPDAGVNSGAMQRQFNETLKRSGALSGRSLKVDADFSREFIILKDKIGEQIDAALSALSDSKYRELSSYIHSSSFDYLSRLKLLEAVKAKSVVKRIRSHLALNRKVVVFHGYNVGGARNPFKLMTEGAAWDKLEGRDKTKIQNQYADFARNYPNFANLKLDDLQSPIETLKGAFASDVMIYNGTVAKKQILQSAKDFNNDSLEKNIILMQTDKGKEGVSLHDTTGKKTRVLINLGLPTKPTDTIQIEGRIYRTGQVSDAIFEYISTGTKYEKRIFADVIATRSSEAENLAMGNEARNLLDAFKNGYLNATSDEPNLDQGHGGKAINKLEEISPFDKAISDYFATQKANKNTKSKGVDYFPTPEPIGLKMVEFANLAAGESALEPSAGHGAIARYMPENTKNTYIEPSTDLQGDLALRTAGNGEIKGGTFEDLYIGNKFNAVIMNPPFGKGGKMAMEHVEKATKHLRDGGRVVALIPDGGMALKRFNEFLERAAKDNIVLTKTIHLPAIAFERAGTSVNTKIVILDRIDDKETRESIYPTQHDFRQITDINKLFDEIESVSTQRFKKLEVTADSVVIDNANAQVLKPEKITLDSIQPFHQKPHKPQQAWTLQSFLRGRY